MAQNANILKVEDIAVFYGKIQAIKHIDLEINEGEIVALIGSNGAGKSTLFNAILGIQPADHGVIRFMGNNITRQSTENIVASGISIVPEGRGVLPQMTVMENLQLGAFYLKHSMSKNLERVFEIFPILAKRRTQQAGTLSGGEQQMLAIARALMGEPKLLLLDEPSLGLAPVIVNNIFKILSELRNSNQTILLSEQNAMKALQYADRGYVLELGVSVYHDTSQALMKNTVLCKAYLGGAG